MRNIISGNINENQKRMASEYKVTSQYIGDSKMYAVFRIKDVSAVDHSGNREYASGYTEDREEALKIANQLNSDVIL